MSPDSFSTCTEHDLRPTNDGGARGIIGVVLSVLLLATNAQAADAGPYRSVAADDGGRLTIMPVSGASFAAPLLHDQVSFSQPSLSTDHTTIGWLANDADPSASGGASDPVAGRLVLFRAGRVLRTFVTDRVFWSWQFADPGNVAFCTGPTHGGAEACELRRIDSGHLRAKWNARAAGEPPVWVKGLTY